MPSPGSSRFYHCWNRDIFLIKILPRAFKLLNIIILNYFAQFLCLLVVFLHQTSIMQHSDAPLFSFFKNKDQFFKANKKTIDTLMPTSLTFPKIYAHSLSSLVLFLLVVCYTCYDKYHAFIIKALLGGRFVFYNKIMMLHHLFQISYVIIVELFYLVFVSLLQCSSACSAHLARAQHTSFLLSGTIV